MKKNRTFSTIIVFILILVLALSGCSSKDESKSENRDDSGTAATATTAKTASDKADKTDAGKTADEAVTNSADIAAPVSESEECETDAAPGSSGISFFSGTSDGSEKAYSSDIKYSAAIASETADADDFYVGAAGDYDITYDYSPEECTDDDILASPYDSFPEEEPAWDDSDTGIDIDDDTEVEDIIIDDPDPIIEYRPQSAGLLTAAEWNDNENFAFLRNLITNGHDADYASFFSNWELTPFSMFKVLCLNGGSVTSSVDANGTPILETVGSVPVYNAFVEVFDTADNLIYTARTNVDGYAYIYYSISDTQVQPKSVRVSYKGQTTTQDITDLKPDGSSTCTVIFDEAEKTEGELDLMFVIDTTGSMGDEISYLQAELSDVINRVRNNNAGLGINLSVNFYRDMEDDYVVRSNPFSKDIDEQLVLLNREYANGGGDFEEAVELALIDAVENHTWSEDSTKLLFIVLDAPPHNTPVIRGQLADVLSKASAMGIRIIPIASSGIDKDTEFLLRTFAMTTGGTYTFLTNDSGIGGSHIEATVGSHVVENLNDLLVRVINNYLNTEKLEPIPYRAVEQPVYNPDPYEPVYIDDDIEGDRLPLDD